MKRKERIIVGMSGGVDSSVTAAILKKRGYDVIGMTMQLLPKEEERQSKCCNLSAVDDAKRVCAQLNIPHYTINSRATFQEKVITPFINSYLAGETPNPCVECNRYIKFDELYARAKDLGATYIATGHYCKRTRSPDGQRYFLKKAKDHSKDQSYFLYMLNSQQLKNILFPLGNYQKSDIRDIALHYKFRNATKPDSQEICFVQGSYKDYVTSKLPEAPKPGPIISTDGKILGQHQGIHAYTIGQRKRLGISSPHPLYVQNILSAQNTLVVGNANDITHTNIHLQQFSTVNNSHSLLNTNVEVKTRYQMTPFHAKVLSIQENTATLSLVKAQNQVSPGQSAVLYKGEFVLGGGVISHRHT
ncbi:MAG: tRNA 2-thiouridine(34) synthase MnmA [bacterium]